jgi:hypothetical protein
LRDFAAKPPLSLARVMLLLRDRRAIMRSILIALVLLVTRAAPAQETDADSRVLVPYGVGLFAGAGVGGFVDKEMRNMTGAAGFWEARLQVGTRAPLGAEIAYVGGLQKIDALGLSEGARLLSTGVEGTLHLHIVPGNLVPYVFAGLGWTRFSLTHYQQNTSDLRAEDDVLAIPVGVGFAQRSGRLITDVRATVRATANEDLLPAGRPTRLSTWSTVVHVGFEL